MTRSERTTLYLRGIPRDVIGEAKAAAARRGTTLANVVTEAMRRWLDPETVPDSSDSLEADFAWFAAHRDQLVRKYEGLYVAIVNGKVIDHDRSFAVLAQRVFRDAGMRPLLMPRVTRAETVVRVRSPRRVLA